MEAGGRALLAWIRAPGDLVLSQSIASLSASVAVSRTGGIIALGGRLIRPQPQPKAYTRVNPSSGRPTTPVTAAAMC
jgi:hypothetical protein